MGLSGVIREERVSSLSHTHILIKILKNVDSASFESEISDRPAVPPLALERHLEKNLRRKAVLGHC